jgi:hypothetical protein
MHAQLQAVEEKGGFVEQFGPKAAKLRLCHAYIPSALTFI